MRSGPIVFATLLLFAVGHPAVAADVRSESSTPSGGPASVAAEDSGAHPLEESREEPRRREDARGDEAIGRPCDKSFMNACPAGLVCKNTRCVREGDARREPTVSSATDANVVYIDRTRAFRLGATNAFFFGLGGKLKDPSPAYSVGLDFGFPTGRSAWWHLELGYENLNDYKGLKASPFVLGYTFDLYEGPVKLEVEVVAALLQTEVLFGDGYAIALSAGLRGQLVLVYGIGWLGFAPLGFETRYAYGLQNVGIATGVGVNWPMLLTVGMEL